MSRRVHSGNARRVNPLITPRPVADVPSVVPGTPAYEAYRMLQFTFVVIPLVAGVDKFFHALVDWHQYLAPSIARLLPLEPSRFMPLVGIVEILAGLLVATMPRLGGYLVAVWLWAIIGNLFLVPGYYDIALRDFGLSLAALALGRLGADADAARQHVVYGTSQIT